jgi:CRP-like cAMP-binding protein
MIYHDAFIRKILKSTNLEQADVDALVALPMHIKTLAAHTNILSAGERPSQSCLMIKGFSLRSKDSDKGKRQILSIHIPGDIPDLESLHLSVIDHDLRTLSECMVGFISHDALRALIRSRPLIGEALWRQTLVDSAIFREWILNVGRRPASERLVHLLMELRERLAAVGLATNDHYTLPMTQIDLADALALSPVHVNRAMQALRAKGVLDIRKSVVQLGDTDVLADIADFRDDYLHQPAN